MLAPEMSKSYNYLHTSFQDPHAARVLCQAKPPIPMSYDRLNALLWPAKFGAIITHQPLPSLGGRNTSAKHTEKQIGLV